jgi:hypothetical protein
LEDYTTRDNLAQAENVAFGLKSCKNRAREVDDNLSQQQIHPGQKVSLFLGPVMLQWL